MKVKKFARIEGLVDYDGHSLTDELLILEVELSVSDYDGDFEECENAADDAEDKATTELQECTDLKAFKITDVTFLEFDSSNPSHATAYFRVEVECDES